VASFQLARRNLRNLLRTASETPAHVLEGVQVALGPPINYEADEVVALLGMDAVDTDWATTTTQEDRWDIAGRIKVHHPWASGEPDEIDALDERAWAIFDACRVIVDGAPGDYQLGGALVDGWAIMTPTSGEDGPLPAVNSDTGEAAGWVEYIPFVVRCTARA
jgi:hypothetical protein